MVRQMKKKKNLKSKRIHDVQLIHRTILQLLGVLPQSKKVNVNNAALINIAKLLYLNKYKPHQTHSSSNSSTTSSSSSRRSSSSSSESESDSSSSSSSCFSSSVSTSSSSDESSSSSITSTNTKSSSTSDMTLSDFTSTELDKPKPKLLQSIDYTTKDDHLQKSTCDEIAKGLEIVFKPLRLSGLYNQKQNKIEDSLSTLKGCHIYVNHLTVNVSVEHIREIFSRYGTIRNINLPLDVFTKLSKGFSYIEYSTPEEAQLAIKRMNGGQIDGREIICIPMPNSAFHTSRINGQGDI